MLDSIKARLLALDPKLVATVFTTIAVYVVADLLNLGLEDPVLGAGALNVTYAQAIALAAGAVAGYWKANAGTILRTPQEDGNPDPKLVEQNGYALIELLVAAILLVVFIWLVFALVD